MDLRAQGQRISVGQPQKAAGDSSRSHQPSLHERLRKRIRLARHARYQWAAFHRRCPEILRPIRLAPRYAPQPRDGHLGTADDLPALGHHSHDAVKWQHDWRDSDAATSAAISAYRPTHLRK